MVNTEWYFVNSVCCNNDNALNMIIYLYSNGNSFQAGFSLPYLIIYITFPKSLPLSISEINTVIN